MNFKKKKQVLTIGYPYFVNRLQELGKGSDFIFKVLPRQRFRKWFTLLQTDLIYIIGGDLRPNRYYRFAFFLKKKIIMHWVGSDILATRDRQINGEKVCPLLLNKAVHWAEVDWTASELSALGVRTQIMPLTPATFPDEAAPFPVKFVALTYLPPGKEEFYGEAQLTRLAADLPEVLFLVAAALPAEIKKEWPSNLIPIGWVDNMAELYKEVTLLIRLTNHDGLSFMVLEALAYGRQVIWSYPFEGVHQARNYHELYQTVNEMYQTFLRGGLGLNHTGREVVRRFYNPQVVWERIDEGIRRVISGWGES